MIRGGTCPRHAFPSSISPSRSLSSCPIRFQKGLRYFEDERSLFATPILDKKNNIKTIIPVRVLETLFFVEASDHLSKILEQRRIPVNMKLTILSILATFGIITTNAAATFPTTIVTETVIETPLPLPFTTFAPVTVTEILTL